MNTECTCEADLWEWLRMYDELERRLESVRGILNKYPTYMPPFNQAALPFERVEILLSDMQKLHDLLDTPHACEGLGDKAHSGAEQ